MVQVVFLGGEDHDGRVGHRANPAAHVQAALAGQHQVEYDDLWLELQERRQGFVTPVLHAHLKTMLRQKVRDQPRQFLVTLNEQDLAQPQVFHKFPMCRRGLKSGHYRWQAGQLKPLVSTGRRSFMLLRVFNK